MYRVLHRHHHRTGNDWKIYPMILPGESDYIELRILSVRWIPNAGIFNQIYNETKVRPRQYEFARLNLNYTVMSKRKLQLVQRGQWMGWSTYAYYFWIKKKDIPLLHSKFCEIWCCKTGECDDVSFLILSTGDLNKTAPRVMVVLDPVKLVILITLKLKKNR
jgi:glutaminyl-tRNA synthetase